MANIPAVATTATVPVHRRLDAMAVAAGLSAPLAWGLTGVFIRWLHGTPTLAIVAARLLLASVVLSPWVMRRRRGLRAFLDPLAVPMGAPTTFSPPRRSCAPRWSR